MNTVIPMEGANALMAAYRGGKNIEECSLYWLGREKGSPESLVAHIYQFWETEPPPVLVFYEDDLFFAIRWGSK
jgi:hypothetical protein